MTVNVERRDDEARSVECKRTWLLVAPRRTYILTHARREESIYSKTVKLVYANYVLKCSENIDDMK